MADFANDRVRARLTALMKRFGLDPSLLPERGNSMFWLRPRRTLVSRKRWYAGASESALGVAFDESLSAYPSSSDFLRRRSDRVRPKA